MGWERQSPDMDPTDGMGERISLHPSHCDGMGERSPHVLPTVMGWERQSQYMNPTDAMREKSPYILPTADGMGESLDIDSTVMGWETGLCTSEVQPDERWSH